MRVTLTLADGSEQVHDVAELSIDVGGWPVEIKSRSERLSLQVHGEEVRWASFAVRPGAANVLNIEVETQIGGLVPSPGTPGEG